MRSCSPCTFFFFFNDTATTEIYTLSLHDALPISIVHAVYSGHRYARELDADPTTLTYRRDAPLERRIASVSQGDRKSTRLNSSHLGISYAVFCLKKKSNANRSSAALELQVSTEST